MKHLLLLFIFPFLFLSCNNKAKEAETQAQQVKQVKTALFKFQALHAKLNADAFKAGETKGKLAFPKDLSSYPSEETSYQVGDQTVKINYISGLNDLSGYTKILLHGPSPKEGEVIVCYLGGKVASLTQDEFDEDIKKQSK